MDERAIRERVARVEEALEELEGLPADPRRTALDAVASLVELYGEGWARALGRLAGEWPGAVEALAEDELVSHLLLIHGLHPSDAESRIRDALASLEEQVGRGRGGVELLGLEDGVARLRIGPNGDAPSDGVRELLRETVLAAAPELEGVAFDVPAGHEGGNGQGGQGLVQLRVPAGLRKGKGRSGGAEEP